jgi:D-alanyl-D-alanine endopeptidase (penicillin-binding protein 7)
MKSCFLGICLLVLGAQAMANQRPAIWLYNITKDQLVLGNHINSPAPIASITKIMTAMVSLDHDGNLDRQIRVPSGGRLPAGEHSRRDVMSAMLIRSDNIASEAIATDYPGGRKAFVAAMNRRAAQIGMMATRFVDPSGLSMNNISTPGSVGTMMIASSMYPFIVETSVQRQALFEINRGRKIRTIEIQNTNQPLLFEFEQIRVSKTGYTSAAGWCVGMLVESRGQEFVIVIMGAPSKQARNELARTTIYNQLRDIEVDWIEEEQQRPWYQRWWQFINSKITKER